MTFVLLSLLVGLSYLALRVFLADAIIWLREYQAEWDGVLDTDHKVFPDGPYTHLHITEHQTSTTSR